MFCQLDKSSYGSKHFSWSDSEAVYTLRWLDSPFSDTCGRVREERAAAGLTSASPDRPWPHLQLQQRVAQKQLWRQ